MGTSRAITATSLATLAMFFFTACRSEPAAKRTESVSAEVKAIRAVVDRYIESVDTADPAIARQVWAERDDISFIHPLGHEEGWAQIKANVYEKLMGGMFSIRHITIKQISIKPHGDTAVVEFYWEFNATWRKDGSPLQTFGRETQVLLKNDAGWKVAHIHYSGMPTQMPSQGL